jgi:hypothetical protein
VQLEVGQLTEPDKARQVVAEEVLLIGARVLREDADGLDEFRKRLGILLLEEAAAENAVGIADEGKGSITEVGQQVGRRVTEIDEEVALGQGAHARRGRPERLIQVGEPKRVVLDADHGASAGAHDLLDHRSEIEGG